VVESRSREYVQQRVRAGVLEHGSVAILEEAGVAGRLRREGMVLRGIQLRFDGEAHRIDLEALTGRTITVYGQQEVVKDLIAARLAARGAILFDAEVDAIRGHDDGPASIAFVQDGERQTIECDFIAGCDGFHGVSRAAIAPGRLTLYERVYPFAWLGILASAPPASEELIYALHDDGFALLSMRSPEITRLYLQCAPDEDVAGWPDERIWRELHRRLEDVSGPRVVEGPILQKGVTPMRSFVAEPMRFGRLFLAGDAAHIVPPTGAKGMNLAVADIRVLARAFEAFYHREHDELLDAYSTTCLRRVWKAQRFSWWMTSMLHRFDADGAFDRRRQLAELDYLSGSIAAQTALAENYVGLPLEE
jgi:p-hydroxybenzoate 3-monooxygenase